MPLIVLFVGVPGSGKTTFTKQLAQEIGAIVLSSDSLRIAMWGDRTNVDANHATSEMRAVANKLTFGAMNYAAQQSIAAGHDVIYDANANRYEERREKYDIAERYGAKAVVIRIKVPYETSLMRLQDRVETHDSRRFERERAGQVIDRFMLEIEEPTAIEKVINIDGEAPFKEQYASFTKQLAKLQHE